MTKQLSIEIDRDEQEQEITNHIFHLLNEIEGVDVMSGYNTPYMDNNMEEEAIIDEMKLKGLESSSRVKKIITGENFLQIQIKYPSWKGEMEIPEEITDFLKEEEWKIFRVVGMNSEGPIAGIQLRPLNRNE